MKRYLDCTASDLEKMDKEGLIKAIAASEGRLIVCETIGKVQPMLGDISNAEFVAAMGADMIILNVFDVNNPEVNGLPNVEKTEIIREIKRLTGCKVGINLEPLEEEIESNVSTDETWKLSSGRKGTLENAKKAVEMGVDFIVLTGNPGIGVTNKAIADTLKIYNENLGDKVVLIAGKMHAAGILSEAGEKIITKKDIDEFISAGADIILMPAPGTVPGITMEYIRELVVHTHNQGKLTLTAIGTSQEGADVATIKEIALMCKMAGTDLHHLGDAGYIGMSLPENILEYGKTIRGVRHTYRRMAMSIKR